MTTLSTAFPSEIIMSSLADIDALSSYARDNAPHEIESWVTRLQRSLDEQGKPIGPNHARLRVKTVTDFNPISGKEATPVTVVFSADSIRTPERRQEQNLSFYPDGSVVRSTTAIERNRMNSWKSIATEAFHAVKEWRLPRFHHEKHDTRRVTDLTDRGSKQIPSESLIGFVNQVGAALRMRSYVTVSSAKKPLIPALSF